MVFDHGIWLEYIGTNLASPSIVLYISPDTGSLGSLLLLLEQEQLGLKHLHGLILVLELGPLILAGNHGSAGEMGDTDGG